MEPQNVIQSIVTKILKTFFFKLGCQNRLSFAADSGMTIFVFLSLNSKMLKRKQIRSAF